VYHSHQIDIMSRVVDHRSRFLAFGLWSDADPLGRRPNSRLRSARLRERSRPDH
jgi:hypothetical protein